MKKPSRSKFGNLAESNEDKLVHTLKNWGMNIETMAGILLFAIRPPYH